MNCQEYKNNSKGLECNNFRVNIKQYKPILHFVIMNISNLFHRKEESDSVQPTPLPTFQTNSSTKDFPATIQESVSTPTPSKEPFFVRIDKFNDAKTNLQSINKKLKDMARILEKIEEVKIREDKELEEWKLDVNGIREYLSKVDEDIFNKI